MTEVTLDSIFSSLESSAKELNNASDVANQTLAEAEQRLVNSNIGIEVWYPKILTCTDSEGGVGAYEKSIDIIDVLGFARVEGKWCLAIKSIRRVSGFYQGDEDCPYTNEFIETPPSPLLKQSRTLRIKAVAALPGFIEHILKEVRSTIHEVTKATIKLGK